VKKDTHTYTASIAQSAHLSSYVLIETSRRLYAEAHIKGTLFVFNKIADQESETYLREELAEEGMKPLGVSRGQVDFRRMAKGKTP
jgi:CO dehydrogenase nickel-insertion accessory protein CooC1